MAHPKRRQSSTRQAKRRTHDKAVAPHWQYAPTVALTMYITQYAPLAVTIVVRWLLRWKTKLLLNNEQ